MPRTQPVETMKTYEFDVILASDVPPEDFDGTAFLDAVEGPVFEAFEGDVTPGTIGGVPTFSGSLDGSSLDAAVAPVLALARQLGYPPVRVEVEPAALAAA